MLTSSNWNIYRVTGHLCEQFTGHRWLSCTQMSVTRCFDVLFDLRLYKRLNKQSWGWWFQMLSRPLWRHSNGLESREIGNLSRLWKSNILFLQVRCRGLFVISWHRHSGEAVQAIIGYGYNREKKMIFLIWTRVIVFNVECFVGSLLLANINWDQSKDD